MEISSLDLREYRCPMALLLVKKTCQHLCDDEQLKLLIADHASADDIFRFLTRNGFVVNVEPDEKMTVFHIQKQKGKIDDRYD